MEAIIITTETINEIEETKNNNKTVNITEDNEHYNDFMKVLAIKNLIDHLVSLPKLPINIDERYCACPDRKTFETYVDTSEVIDHYFANLIEGYFDECECDDACVCDACTCQCCEDDEADCDNCDHTCSHGDDEDYYDDMNEAIIHDALKLAFMFKPVFNLENVKEDSEVKVVMTGKEYLDIKEILDKYDFDKVKNDEQSKTSNT